MRLLTYRAKSGPTLGMLVGDRVLNLGALLPPYLPAGQDWPSDAGMRELLEGGDRFLAAAREVERRAASALAECRIEAMPYGAVVGRMDQVTVLAPILNPRKMLYIGLNYADHAAEAKMDIPSVPTVFAKFASAIVGQGDAIVLPRFAPGRVDLEAELAVVIGKKGRNISEERALDYVAGYTIANDVTARDVQKSQTQWLMAKTPDTFAPIGPVIVTSDEIPDPRNLIVRSWLNGTRMQQASTEDMIFPVSKLVSYISSLVTLEPGDLISTGTPPGVGFARKPPVYLKPGDIVRVEVEGIGYLENRVVTEDE